MSRSSAAGRQDCAAHSGSIGNSGLCGRVSVVGYGFVITYDISLTFFTLPGFSGGLARVRAVRGSCHAGIRDARHAGRCASAGRVRAGCDVVDWRSAGNRRGIENWTAAGLGDGRSRLLTVRVGVLARARFLPCRMNFPIGETGIL